MPVDRNALEDMSRDELVEHARKAGVARAEVMTRVELTDEILRRSTEDPIKRRQVRGWLGVARDLLASVVEQGLNLPDAAAVIRGDVAYKPRRAPPAPVATVTLAEIYAAQGHYDRALQMLDEVISTEPDHQVATELRKRLADQALEVAQRRERLARGLVDDLAEESDEWSSIEEAFASDEESAAEQGEDDGDSVDALPDDRGSSDLDELTHDTETEGACASAARATEVRAGGVPPPTSEAQPPSTSVKSETEEAPSEESGPRFRQMDDAVVIFTTNPGEVCVYWERSDERREHGRFVVDIVEMQQSPKGARRIDRRLDAPQAAGGIRVPGITEGAVVRAALGVERDGRFHPLCVAAELGIDADGLRVLFTPRSQAFEDVGRRAAAFFDASV